MANTEFRVSTLIENQVPDFVQADNPVFVQFLKAYYEWLENSEEGAVIYETRKLLDYADVDRTSDEFVKYFKTKFLPFFPEDVLADKAKLIKNIRSFYQEKGSEESLKLLFRVLYNEEIDIFYPKEQILIASDGKWKQPQALRLTVANTANNFDVALLKGRRGVGSVSKASCIIESAYRTIDRDFGFEVFEVYVSSVNRQFENGENFVVEYRDENGALVTLLSEPIIGSLSSITIDPNNRGLQYQVGDPVVIFGGLSENSTSVRNATAFVGNVTSGGINSLEVQAGGYGFRQSPDSEVTFTNAITDNVGFGATAQVTSVDGANAVTIYVNTDTLSNISNVTIGNTTYQMTNFAFANINTELALALGFDQINVAPIETVTLTSPGSFYQVAPTVDVTSYYDVDVGRQDLLSLGLIAAVEVISGGTGYDSNTDTIFIDGLGNGNGAAFTFTTNATGHILSVSVTNPGEGYRTTNVGINTSNGSGAILRAWRYGEGETIGSTVDAIGRIRSITLSNRGAGYVSTPTVSLRVKEIALSNVSGIILNGDTVYQGADENNYTFTATVDSYDTANNRLRVFDYLGTLDVELPLKFPSFEATVVSSFNYGNGLAKATAKFSNGLINYQGFYLNTDGFLSSDMRLQDDRKYHNYSYVVIAERALADYRNALLDVLHPSGMSILGYVRVIAESGYSPVVTSNVTLSNASVTVGNVTANAFFANAAIVGTGTAFESLNVGDLIVINSGDSTRKFVKEIVNVASNTLLTVESNTTFIGDGRLEIETSNVNVVVSGNTEPLNLIAGDVIRYSANGSTYDALVVSVSGGVVETNLASASSNTNVLYQVFPTLINVSYTTISS